ncbi:ABC transporter permease subunit [Evansella sp. AB-rgal1]|uniref:ABC transporter permease subunit n=1 Tax=Evansella sp. AB-rgal1 TaxID=3242696 RepID=UPI00359EE8E5
MGKITNQFAIVITYLVLFITITLLALLPRGVVFISHDYHVERNFSIVWSQYAGNIKSFLFHLFRGDLGLNIYDQPVMNDISLYFLERSLPVIIGAFSLSLLLGVILGTCIFALKGKKIGKVSSSFVWSLQALPDFFFYILIQMLLFQLFRWGFPSFSFYGYDDIHNYLIAMFIVSLFPSAFLALIIAPLLGEEENKRYIVTAKSKGITPFIVLWKHQWMNIMNRMVRHIHTVMVMVIGNLLIFEYMFYMRGAAMRLYQAMGFHGASIRGGYRSISSDGAFEVPVIIWLFACFLLVSFFAHIIQSILSSYLDRRLN